MEEESKQAASFITSLDGMPRSATALHGTPKIGVQTVLQLSILESKMSHSIYQWKVYCILAALGSLRMW